ncbi:MAG: CvpA family protein [Proteobacteria bacterium]|nr:CvpA family protein [Pseudomonadota bacterium]
MIADIVVAVVLLISGVIALFRGFVKETLTIAGWIGAIFITLYGYQYIAPLLSDFITDSWVAELVAASALFLLSLVILTIVSHMIASRVQGSVLGHLDRALGFVFGLVRGMALVSLVYLISTLFWEEGNLPDQIHEARSLPLVKIGADFLANLAPEDTFPGRKDAGDRIDDAVEGIKEGMGEAFEGVAKEKLDEMIDEIDAEERLRRLNEPEPETTAPEADTAPELPPGELPPPPGYEEEERSDMQRLIESNQ